MGSSVGIISKTDKCTHLDAGQTKPCISKINVFGTGSLRYILVFFLPRSVKNIVAFQFHSFLVTVEIDGYITKQAVLIGSLRHKNLRHVVLFSQHRYAHVEMVGEQVRIKVIDFIVKGNLSFLQNLLKKRGSSIHFCHGI